jgi:hypothetical protein
VTYLNANFGPNFYRSSGTIKLESATASVYAKGAGFEVDLSASATDPNETSSGFSSYDVGTVNAGPGSLNSLSVSPRTLVLSGSAHVCMNLWFDSDHDGEYFVWEHNQFAGLGGDVYAICACNSGGTVTIEQTTPLFLIPHHGGQRDHTGRHQRRWLHQHPSGHERREMGWDRYPGRYKRQREGQALGPSPRR